MSPTPIGSDPSKPQSDAVKAYMAGQPYISKWNNYFSRIRVSATSGGAGAVYSVPAGNEFIGFGYARGGDMGPAGAPGVIATYADTNIQTPSQTIAGEILEVDGIGMILLGQSDAALAKQLDQNLSVKIRMNGNTDYPLGIPSMIPGPGGLFGVSDAQSVASNLGDQAGIQIGSLNNGIPYAMNYFALPEPMVWANAGKQDSTLNVIVKTERTTTTLLSYTSANRAAVAGGATTQGTAAYTAPLFAAVFLDYMIVVIARTVTRVSDN
jgi:hypothetical protein